MSVQQSGCALTGIWQARQSGLPLARVESGVLRGTVQDELVSFTATASQRNQLVELPTYFVGSYSGGSLVGSVSSLRQMDAAFFDFKSGADLQLFNDVATVGQFQMSPIDQNDLAPAVSASGVGQVWNIHWHCHDKNLIGYNECAPRLASGDFQVEITGNHPGRAGVLQFKIIGGQTPLSVIKLKDYRGTIRDTEVLNFPNQPIFGYYFDDGFCSRDSCYRSNHSFNTKYRDWNVWFSDLFGRHNVYGGPAILTKK